MMKLTISLVRKEVISTPVMYISIKIETLVYFIECHEFFTVNQFKSGKALRHMQVILSNTHIWMLTSAELSSLTYWRVLESQDLILTMWCSKERYLTSQEICWGTDTVIQNVIGLVMTFKPL